VTTPTASNEASSNPGAPAEGIDVSGYQQTVNWASVKQAGKSFAFIKATEGTTLVDRAFGDHWTKAKTAGLLRGAYHFLRPEHDAVAQAQFFLAQLANDAGEMPPVLDVEVTDRISLAQIASSVSAWIDYVGANLGRALIYTSPGFWNLLPGIPGVGTRADLWIASWSARPPARVNGWPTWTFWQYTAKATVAGIPGSADMDADRYNGTLEELQAYCARVVGMPSLPAPSFDLATTLGVQQALNSAHAVTPPLDEDGLPGPKTTAAIKAFQTSAGLDADGIVGTKTTAALQAAVATAAAT
jgi:lysozyme